MPGHGTISMYKAPIVSAPTFIHKSFCPSMWEKSPSPFWLHLSAHERHDKYLPIVGVALFLAAGNLHFLNGSIADRLQIWSLNYRSMFSMLHDQILSILDICHSTLTSIFCDPIWIWHPTGLPYVSSPFQNICFLFYFGPCWITWNAVPSQAQ